MSRGENIGQPMNHGSVFKSTTVVNGGGGSNVPLFDGEPLDEICADVNGVAMWVTPYIIQDASNQTQRTTIYLDSAGQQLTGTITATDPDNCPCLITD